MIVISERTAYYCIYVSHNGGQISMEAGANYYISKHLILRILLE